MHQKTLLAKWKLWISTCTLAGGLAFVLIAVFTVSIDDDIIIAVFILAQIGVLVLFYLNALDREQKFLQGELNYEENLIDQIGEGQS